MCVSDIAESLELTCSQHELRSEPFYFLIVGVRDIAQAGSGPLTHTASPSQPPQWFILVHGSILTCLALSLWDCHKRAYQGRVREEQEGEGGHALLKPISSCRFPCSPQAGDKPLELWGSPGPKYSHSSPGSPRHIFTAQSKMHAADYKHSLSLHWFKISGKLLPKFS